MALAEKETTSDAVLWRSEWNEYFLLKTMKLLEQRPNSRPITVGIKILIGVTIASKSLQSTRRINQESSKDLEMTNEVVPNGISKVKMPFW
ncbi:MAG: hypothetical protein KJ804_20490 [Proteobacteria bacterium]|nr:hypothetical protein [Pseudomonadota bacterium]